MNRTLSVREGRFVAEYLRDLNATQAAIRAGYAAKRANAQAYLLLARPHVAAAIQAKQQERLHAAGIDAQRVLNEIAAIAFADLGQFLTISDTGEVKINFAQARQNTKVLLEFSQEEFLVGAGDNAVPARRTKIKLHPKLKSLEILAKYLKLFDDHDDVAARDTMAGLARFLPRLWQALDEHAAPGGPGTGAAPRTGAHPGTAGPADALVLAGGPDA